ncbi:ABC transporter substrate-binding protein [Geobacillus thermodenitrificans]|uniref:ABC transporter substrate-binding protein n=1 Tax=Geobacillus thermodenitrificans TaxID=33940 RepID=UPI000C29048F|nr:extracellular solute-binding protein [Geobacillus thermodenitrificans]MEC5187692.1 raffinose/stachyose/melibiose transport system substrate-binding protein [Geobacillus thermodenitrificans]MED0662244.1 binding protein msmE [Geobacillus thermodenitrificans]PJW21762.1 binding protein msmE [Geobacillus thermodenitrificans]
MKKIMTSVLIVILLFSLVVGCSRGTESGSDSSKVKLTVFSTINDEEGKAAFQEITKQFEKENPNIDVEVNFPGQEYENILKVKMAANDLPDVFDTHGWAQIRYGKYVADLSKESWASNLTDSMKPVLTDESGKVYALPLNEAKDGIMYNANILEKYGIKPPATFDELLAAAEKIKKESNGQIIPFYFSGVDSWTIGQFFDYFSTSLLVSPKENYSQDLLNGTFDWSKWTYLPEKFKEMYKKGLINKDVLTAKYSDLPKLFAEGKVAFAMMGPVFVGQAKEINPNVKVGYMPVPSIVQGDEPTFSGGERNTLAVWKDSKNLNEAIKFVNFFAQSDNLKKIAEATGLPAGLKGIDPDLGDLTKYYEEYADIRVFPYFDRVYLPNGMWDVMCTNGQEIIAGSITPKQFSENMKKQYQRLREQQKAQ